MSGFFLYILLKKRIRLPGLLTACVLTVILINVWLNTGFYPKLLNFQGSIPVSRFIRDNHLNKERVFLYKMEPVRSLDFYSDYSYKTTKRPDSLQTSDYLLTNKMGMTMVNQDHFRIIDSGIAFHVTTLSLPVLNPATRKDNSDAWYLMARN
jgi:hypothetical protein